MRKLEKEDTGALTSCDLGPIVLSVNKSDNHNSPPEYRD